MFRTKETTELFAEEGLCAVQNPAMARLIHSTRSAIIYYLTARSSLASIHLSR